MLLRFKRSKKQALLVCFCLVGYAVAAQHEPLDVKKAVDLALANNRSLRADSLNISVTDSRNKEYAAQYRPQVNYSTATEYNAAIASQMLPGSMVGQPGKELVPVQFGTRYNFRTGVELTQTIYRKDVLLQMRTAGLNNNIAKTKHTLSRENLVYQVAATFYSLQTNAETIRKTKRDYQNMKEVLAIAKAQYENGLLKKIDLQSIEINLANTESQLQQLQTQYDDQLTYFNYLLGLPAAAPTIIDTNITDGLVALDAGKNLLQREDVRLSYQKIESKEAELNAIRAERLPSINSYFRYNYQSQFNDVSDALKSDYLFNSSTVGVTMKVPILDGSQRKHRINTAKIQLEQLKLESQYKQEQAQMELVSAYGVLSNYEKQYLITQRNLQLATDVFNSRKALYAEGVTTLMELLDAESELSQARNLHMQALINLHTAKLDLHKANGTLLTEFVKSL